MFRDLAKNSKPAPYLEEPIRRAEQQDEADTVDINKEIENVRLKTYLFFSNWAGKFKN